ncbi:hypothetical protein ACFXOS_19765 [Streptomyces sp. NPDC059175]|uniref:hypothetical protein n=1 Tax=Streptomyces sp. NPDC059175 TaxID=3346757 RepID=UPI0036A90806
MGWIDWGDMPTWVAAVFAGGAALFAGLTLRSQRKQLDKQQEFIDEQSTNLQLEREILRADADDRRRQQARTIRMEPILQAAGGGAPGSRVEYWKVNVRNRSDDPIHDVTVRFGHESEADTATTGMPAAQTTTPAPLGILGAGSDARFESAKLDPGILEGRRPVLLFTDNAGVRWSRDEHGDMTEVPAPSAP